MLVRFKCIYCWHVTNIEHDRDTMPLTWWSWLWHKIRKTRPAEEEPRRRWYACRCDGCHKRNMVGITS